MFQQILLAGDPMLHMQLLQQLCNSTVESYRKSVQQPMFPLLIVIQHPSHPSVVRA